MYISFILLKKVYKSFDKLQKYVNLQNTKIKQFKTVYRISKNKFLALKANQRYQKAVKTINHHENNCFFLDMHHIN